MWQRFNLRTNSATLAVRQLELDVLAGMVQAWFWRQAGMPEVGDQVTIVFAHNGSPLLPEPLVVLCREISIEDVLPIRQPEGMFPFFRPPRRPVRIDMRPESRIRESAELSAMFYLTGKPFWRDPIETALPAW